MKPIQFNINKQLVADSHELFEHCSCYLRLHKNAVIPWVIIIPKTDVIEYCDLPIDLQLEINQLGKTIGDFFKFKFGVEKINFAAIGNVVQQLHVHVVGRHPNDPLWPNVVWGHQLSEKAYSSEQITMIKNSVFNQLKGT